MTGSNVFKKFFLCAFFASCLPHAIAETTLELFSVPAKAAADVVDSNASPLKASEVKRAIQARPGHTAVQLNLTALTAMVPASEVNFTLPGLKGRHLLVFERLENGANGAVTWIGHLKVHGKSYRAILTGNQNQAFGRILTPEGEFKLQTDVAGQFLVDTAAAGLKEVLPTHDDMLVPPNAAALKAQSLLQGADEATSPPPAQGIAPQPNVTVDVMVLYTPGMVSTLGSVPGVQTRIANLVALTNQTYIDSEVAITLRLVYTALVNYSDSIDISTALSALTNRTDPAFANVANLRAAYGADFVTLLRPYVGGNACGVGWLGGYNNTPISGYSGYAYSAVANGSFGGGGSCSEFTFAHELGHNMGNQHDRRTDAYPSGPGVGAYSYSFGYGLDNAFVSVMAYPSSYTSAPRIGRFSNPGLFTCLGLQCGVSEFANNSANDALSMNNVRVAVSNFMPSCDVTTVSPLRQSAGYSSTQGSLSVQVSGGCAWNATSNTSWIKLVSGASGQGNTNLTYSVDANPSNSARVGSLSVSGQTVTITQSGFNSAASNSSKADVRTYVPSAAAASGYTSFVRVINTGSIATEVSVAVVDALTGAVGAPGLLADSLAAGAAATFTSTQIEAVVGPIAANLRPRLRLLASAGATLEGQSFLLQPGGAFNEVSGAQTGSAVTVPTFVPAAAATTGYVSYVRVINTGNVPTAVSVARVDPATGETGTLRNLTDNLAPGGARTFSAGEIEAALGFAIGAAERPRLLVATQSTPIEVQSFLLQPGGAFTNLSGSQSGSTVDVPSYVPAASPGYTSFVRLINKSAAASLVTVAVIDPDTGLVSVAKAVAPALAGNSSITLSSAQIEAALGLTLSAASRPRIRLTAASATLEVQSFLLQPGGAYNEISNGTTGTLVNLRTYVPAADTGTGYTSYVRVINTGLVTTSIRVALVDAVTGVQGSSSVLMAAMPAGGARTFNSSQIETALGRALPAGTRARLAVSGDQILQVQSFLTQPGGAFTEVSSGQ